MKVIIITTNNFRKEAKKLLKKYHSLKNELKEFSKALQKNPKLGIQITKNTFKIRLAVKSKGKGKSGGMRIITYLYIKVHEKEELTQVYLLSIYDKSEFQNISEKVLKELIKDIQNNLE